MGERQATPRDIVPGFAGRIAAAREARGWSQSELARQAGMSVSTVNGIEREVRSPSLRIAAQLAAVLGLRAWLHDPAGESDSTPTGREVRAVPAGEPIPPGANVIMTIVSGPTQDARPGR